LVCHRIWGIGARSLKFVAAVAGGAKIGKIIVTAADSGRDVVNHQRHTNESPGRLAIFTAVMGTRKDLLPERFWHSGHS
jgi:hypothetical protein